MANEMQHVKPTKSTTAERQSLAHGWLVFVNVWDSAVHTAAFAPEVFS